MISLRSDRAGPIKQTRLFYLDWLRVLAVFAVFWYHTFRPFDNTDWHVKNAQQSVVITIIITSFGLWGMPLFFVLAGAASWFALRSRSPRQFLRERSLRLLVPLLVGLLLFSPLQAYFEALNQGRFAGSFLQFIPWFLAQPQLSWHLPWINYPYHLWFLEFLWICSLLALPLFLFLQGPAGSRVVDTLAEWCRRPGGICLFIVPLALVRVTVWIAFPGLNDWGDLALYLTCFVSGYLLFSRPAFLDAIRQQGWIALGLGIGCLLLTGVAYAAGWLETWASASNYTPGALLYQVMPVIYVWAMLVFVLFCGRRWLNFNTKRLAEANDVVLPFYVLHQPAIVVIAFYVVQWPLGILPKWLIISTLALALTLTVYVLAIRPARWMRWLFGMKPHDRALRQDKNASEQERQPEEAFGDAVDQAAPMQAGPVFPSAIRSGPADEVYSPGRVTSAERAKHPT